MYGNASQMIFKNGKIIILDFYFNKRTGILSKETLNYKK